MTPTASKQRRHQLRQLDAVASRAALDAGVLRASEQPADRPAEPSTNEVGANAESLAVDLLVEHGYEIVERNYRCDIGELDIVAIDGPTMVFVEVRSRASDDHGDAIESVNRRKQRKVTRVAEVYLAHRQPPHEEFRFDVVAINGPDDITHYEDAWRGGLL